MISNKDSRLAFREYLTAASITIGMLALSVLLHLKWCGTPMRSTEERWHEIFEYHRTFYPFSVRPLTTYPLLYLHDLIGFSLKWLFFSLQYLLAALLGMAFFRYLRTLALSPKWSLVGLVLLLGSFPIVFAHSEPVFTWDDMWVYLFLTLCCTSILNRSSLTAGLWFGAACLAREQTLLFWPVLLLGLRLLCSGSGLKRNLAAAYLPVLVVLGYWAVVWQSPDPARFSLLAYNFQSKPFVINSLFSLFISFGFIWAAWIAGALSHKPLGLPTTATQSFLTLGSLYAVLVTLPIGLALSYARETRIFFPPFVFVFPLGIVWLRDMWRRWQDVQPRRTVRRTVVIAFIAAGIAISKPIFTQFDYRNCVDFCRLWGGIHMGMTLFLVALVLLLKAKASAETFSTNSGQTEHTVHHPPHMDSTDH